MRTEAQATLDDALTTAARLGDRGLATRARVTAAWQPRQGLADWDPEQVRAIAEDAIATFGELVDERGLAEAWRLLAATDGGRRPAGGGLRAPRTGIRARRGGRRRADPQLGNESLTEVLTTGPIPVEDATRRCEELHSASSGQPLLEATVESRLANLYVAAGRFDEGRECLQRARAVLDELSWAVGNYLRLQEAQTLRLLGDDAAAEQQLLAMWRHFGEEASGGTNFFAGIAASNLARHCCDEGCWDEAEHWFARATEVPMPTRSAAFAARLTSEARLAAHRGALDEAVTLARQAVEIQEQTDYVYPRAVASPALAEVLRANNQAEEADAALEHAVGILEQKGNVAAIAQLRAGRLSLG
jgi:tetratricopeptide (TPR) repeat protein